MIIRNCPNCDHRKTCKLPLNKGSNRFKLNECLTYKPDWGRIENIRKSLKIIDEKREG